MEEKVSQSKFYYNIVVATDLKNGFGSQGRLPWKIPEEMKPKSIAIKYTK